MSEAKGDKARKGGVSDAPEADEAYGALWVGNGSAKLWAAEEERSPVVGRPLVCGFKI